MKKGFISSYNFKAVYFEGKSQREYKTATWGQEPRQRPEGLLLILFSELAQTALLNAQGDQSKVGIILGVWGAGPSHTDHN